MEVIKQEYIEKDRAVKKIKRDAGILPKIEENSLTTMAYNPFAFNFSPMTFPWLGNGIVLPYLLQNFNLHSLYPIKQQINKPFLIVKESKDDKPLSPPSTSTLSVKTEDTIEIKTSVERKKKKAVRVSACKNYIGLLCAGFARTLLTAENGSEVLSQIKELLSQRKDKYGTLRDLDDEELVDFFKRCVYKSMCGKKVKKSNRERDFKVRNTEELDDLLISKDEDNEITCLRKEVLKEMVNFFFNSDCYNQWLSKGMISESNRFFFINNKEEIQKKFLNPATYKPKFNHGSRLEF